MRAEADGLAQRALEAVLTLGILVLFTFVLFKILPGSPFDDEVQLHPAVRASLEKSWALDAPWTTQLARYAGGLLQGDLGVSLVDQKPVAHILREGFGATLALNALALVAVFVIGFGLAVFSFDRPGSDLIPLFLISLPSLFLGPLLLWVFSMKLNLFPVAFLDGPWHYVLPVLTLALRPAAVLARLLNRALGEARTADYMRTARAKGLSRRATILRHALRNSLLPVLGYGGPLIFGLLSGSFIVEALFAIHGLGGAFVAAVGNRDLPVILGLTLFYGAMLIVISLALDMLMRVADPRLKDGP